MATVNTESMVLARFCVRLSGFLAFDFKRCTCLHTARCSPSAATGDTMRMMGGVLVFWLWLKPTLFVDVSTTQQRVSRLSRCHMQVSDTTSWQNTDLGYDDHPSPSSLFPSHTSAHYKKGFVVHLSIEV